MSGHYEITGDEAKMVEALFKVTTDIEPIVKDARANAGRMSYSYAGLPNVLDAVKPALRAHGILLMQLPIAEEGVAGVVTILAGEGWMLKSRLAFPLSKSGPQDIGSLLTYCRRYGLMGILNLAPDDDDDGARAQRRHEANGKRNGNGQAPAPPKADTVLAQFAPYGVGRGALEAELNGTPLEALPPAAVDHLRQLMGRLKAGGAPLDVFGVAAQPLIEAPTTTPAE